jgi:hypothetical protein
VVVLVIAMVVALVNNVSLRACSFFLSFPFLVARFASDERSRGLNGTIPNVSEGVRSLRLGVPPADALLGLIINLKMRGIGCEVGQLTGLYRIYSDVGTVRLWLEAWSSKSVDVALK